MNLNMKFGIFLEARKGKVTATKQKLLVQIHTKLYKHKKIILLIGKGKGLNRFIQICKESL